MGRSILQQLWTIFLPVGDCRMNQYHLIFCFLFLVGCFHTEVHQECYEPFYLNETSFDVSLFYGSIGKYSENLESMTIQSGDTLYSIPGKDFPFLHEEGLLYDVRLVFDTNPKRCLTYTGDDYHQHDIRDFSSYENLGPCPDCSMRGQSIPKGMLYRITDDLLDQAIPCVVSGLSSSSAIYSF